MAEEKSNKQEKKNKSNELEEVDVSFDEEDFNLESDTLDEISKEEIKPPIPEEWKGKFESEIALLQEIQELKQKLENSEKTWFDKYARLQAEFDNFQKRSLKEKVNYINYANSELISKLLPILDSSEIMLNNLEKKLEPNEFQGIQMVFNELFEVFKKEGLTPIKAIGEKFDPFIHEILNIEYTDEYPEETIIEEFQKGYKLKDRIIRPSKVKIIKLKQVIKEKTDSEKEEKK
ncbi:MAG: nucleotide exchange factor GrpE [Promethearchaeota archaeon]